MEADEIRSTVLKSLREPLKQRGLHVVESGQRLRDEKVIERVDEEHGSWKPSNGDDPQRWLVRIIPDGQGGFAIAPLDVQGYRLGIASAKTGRGPTAAVVVRIGAFVATGDATFKLQADWVWLLWFVLAKPLPESIGNAARMNRFNVREQTVAFQEAVVRFTECGLVGVLDPATQVTTPAFQNPLTYGEVTRRLAEFIEAGAPEQPAAQAADVDNQPEGGANA